MLCAEITHTQDKYTSHTHDMESTPSTEESEAESEKRVQEHAAMRRLSTISVLLTVRAASYIYWPFAVATAGRLVLHGAGRRLWRTPVNAVETTCTNQAHATHHTAHTGMHVSS